MARPLPAFDPPPPPKPSARSLRIEEEVFQLVFTRGFWEGVTAYAERMKISTETAERSVRIIEEAGRARQQALEDVRWEVPRLLREEQRSLAVGLHEQKLGTTYR